MFKNVLYSYSYLYSPSIYSIRTRTHHQIIRSTRTHTRHQFFHRTHTHTRTRHQVSTRLSTRTHDCVLVPNLVLMHQREPPVVRTEPATCTEQWTSNRCRKFHVNSAGSLWCTVCNPKHCTTTQLLSMCTAWFFGCTARAIICVVIYV